MNITAIVLPLVGFLFLVIQNLKFDFYGPTDTGFRYALNGKPITPENNPTFNKKGIRLAWGINQRFFKTSRERSRYKFTSHQTEFSPYDESLDWDGSEGVTQETNFVINGQVSDPHLFYTNFGLQMRDYDGVFKKSGAVNYGQVYEAERWSGLYADIIMGEITQLMDSDWIRVNTATVQDILLNGIAGEDLVKLWNQDDYKKSGITPPDILGVKPFMQQFGFSVVNLELPDPVRYPGGDIITASRATISAVNSDIRAKKEEITNAELNATSDLTRARSQADAILATASREATRIQKETEALANEIRERVDLVGVEGALRLEASEVFRDFSKAGGLGRVYASPDSILGRTLYPTSSSVATEVPASQPKPQPASQEAPNVLSFPSEPGTLLNEPAVGE